MAKQAKPKVKKGERNTDRPNGKAWSKRKWPEGVPSDVLAVAVKHSRKARQK